MEDTQLYAMLLGIKFPWRVNKVQVDMVLTVAVQHIYWDIYFED